MGEHSSWFDLLPGLHNLQVYLKGSLGRDKLMVEQFPSHFSLGHVVAVAAVLVLVTIGALRFSSAMGRGGRDSIVPPPKFNFRNLMEMLTDAILGVAEGVMGEKNARRFLPLIGTLAFFIFFSNVMALFPGFEPPTANLKTNLALALTVFLVTHIYGVKEHGLAYFKHFLGPVWWLSWLMLPIELVSHFARPLSLSVRLLGNLFADHKVVGTLFALVPLLVPVPFLILGVLVCIVQTLVFCLLSMVYIQGAIAHEGHGDEAGDNHGHDAHGHGHEAAAHH